MEVAPPMEKELEAILENKAFYLTVPRYVLEELLDLVQRTYRVERFR